MEFLPFSVTDERTVRFRVVALDGLPSPPARPRAKTSRVGNGRWVTRSARASKKHGDFGRDYIRILPMAPPQAKRSVIEKAKRVVSGGVFSIRTRNPHQTYIVIVKAGEQEPRKRSISSRCFGPGPGLAAPAYPGSSQWRAVDAVAPAWSWGGIVAFRFVSQSLGVFSLSWAQRGPASPGSTPNTCSAGRRPNMTPTVVRRDPLSACSNREGIARRAEHAVRLGMDGHAEDDFLSIQRAVLAGRGGRFFAHVGKGRARGQR